MEDKNVKNVRTRRELILAVLRYAALGGLVGGISLLGRRKGEPDCRRSDACSACPMQDSCTLPKSPH